MSNIFLNSLSSDYNRIGNASKSPKSIKKGNTTYNLSGRYSVSAEHKCSLKTKAYAAIVLSLGLALFSQRVREARKGRKVKVVYVSGSIPSDQKDLSTLKEAFAKCKEAYDNIGNSPDKFIDQLSKLSSLIENEKEDVTLLNEILNFKNEVRAACLPANEKALKGPASFKKIKLKKKDQDALRAELKNVRSAVLKKHFKNRLEIDKGQLDQLKAQWDTFKTNYQPDEIKYIEDQLLRWETKNEAGKPISIPKWYHCTEQADTQRLILQSGVLVKDDKNAPGAFVGNAPREGYGDFGLAFSSHIEKITPSSQNQYPKQTYMEFPGFIKFGDEPQPAEMVGARPQLDIGFQGEGKINAIGIPIHRIKIIQDKEALKYYEDTTLSTLFNKENLDVSRDFALANRVQVTKLDHIKALNDFIAEVFTLTLPPDWDGKVI